MGFNWPNEDISSETGRKALRQAILESITVAASGHPGGSLSLVEILSVIYSGFFEHRVREPDWAQRDRLVLSKGHGVPALYAVLSYQGFFPADELLGLRRLGHFLQGHPDKRQYPLMEASTGSLGQGASVALGLALGLRHSFEAGDIKRLPRVFCVLGDGEMQEGQVWECLMAAGKFQPGNLVFILDRNKGQIDGPVAEVMSLDPLEAKLNSFNVDARAADGHNVDDLKNVLSSWEVRPNARPLFIVADTVKGKGISFMEHPTKWHGAAPKPTELEAALDELFGGLPSPFGRLISSGGLHK